ncbi:unnamed protein product [Natator depressus]
MLPARRGEAEGCWGDRQHRVLARGPSRTSWAQVSTRPGLGASWGEGTYISNGRDLKGSEYLQESSSSEAQMRRVPHGAGQPHWERRTCPAEDSPQKDKGGNRRISRSILQSLPGL